MQNRKLLICDTKLIGTLPTDYLQAVYKENSNIIVKRLHYILEYFVASELY